jgi:hypothetical protein
LKTVVGQLTVGSNPTPSANLTTGGKYGQQFFQYRIYTRQIERANYYWPSGRAIFSSDKKVALAETTKEDRYLGCCCGVCIDVDKCHQ